MTGSRVLLMDGDARRAGLTRRLAAARRCGMLDVLSRTAAVDEALLHEASTGLTFLPSSGPAPTNVSPPEMLGSREMVRMMSALKCEFDIIVVDAPPLLPVIDGRILADHADQIVFVMTWRRTPKQLARKSLASLGFNQSKLVGVVVNDVAEGILDDISGFDRATGYGHASSRPAHMVHAA
ncbi:MAG: CpsD/CapB family tyrosine-protein kinase [Hyphomicrobiaceae bacterium]